MPIWNDLKTSRFEDFKRIYVNPTCIAVAPDDRDTYAIRTVTNHARPVRRFFFFFFCARQIVTRDSPPRDGLRRKTIIVVIELYFFRARSPAHARGWWNMSRARARSKFRSNSNINFRSDRSPAVPGAARQITAIIFISRARRVRHSFDKPSWSYWSRRVARAPVPRWSEKLNTGVFRTNF